MFDVIGFDPKTLTNEQLLDRHLDLSRKKVQAARFGKVDMMSQLHLMIQMIERERYERMYVERVGTVIMNAGPVIVESDPGMQEKPVEDDKPKKSEPIRNYPKPIRSSVPERN